MHKLISVFFLFSFLLILGCDDGTITSDEVVDYCSNISGTYSGSYTDHSCNNTDNSDSISNFTITDGCDATITAYLLSSGATISNIGSDGDSFDVTISNPPSSDCGSLSGSCSKTGSSPISYTCNYSWSEGGYGTMSIEKQ